MSIVVQADLRHRAEDFDLDPEIIRGLWTMEDRHFWHAARNRWILRALRAGGVQPPAAILEVGCGSGATARCMHLGGYRLTGIDTAEPLIRKAHERAPDATFIAGEVERLPATAGPFDALCFFDVLEHLDDPVSLLRQSLRLARPGALVLATVPGLRALHSVIDDISGHKKRFEPGELARLLSAAGLVDVDERGIFRLIMLALKRFRSKSASRNGQRAASALTLDEKRALMIDNFRIPWRPANLALNLVCALEEKLGYRLARNRPGASFLASGRVAV